MTNDQKIGLETNLSIQLINKVMNSVENAFIIIPPINFYILLG